MGNLDLLVTYLRDSLIDRFGLEGIGIKVERVAINSLDTVG